MNQGTESENGTNIFCNKRAREETVSEEDHKKQKAAINEKEYKIKTVGLKSKEMENQVFLKYNQMVENEKNNVCKYEIKRTNISKYNYSTLKKKKVPELKEILENYLFYNKIPFHWTWLQNKEDLIHLILDPTNPKFKERNPK